MKVHVNQQMQTNPRHVQIMVSSKTFNKGGSKCINAHNVGVAQLQTRPYFQRWKYGNLV